MTIDCCSLALHDDKTQRTKGESRLPFDLHVSHKPIMDPINLYPWWKRTKPPGDDQSCRAGRTTALLASSLLPWFLLRVSPLLLSLQLLRFLTFLIRVEEFLWVKLVLVCSPTIIYHSMARCQLSAPSQQNAEIILQRSRWYFLCYVLIAGFSDFSPSNPSDLSARHSHTNNPWRAPLGV